MFGVIAQSQQSPMNGRMKRLQVSVHHFRKTWYDGGYDGHGQSGREALAAQDGRRVVSRCAARLACAPESPRTSTGCGNSTATSTGTVADSDDDSWDADRLALSIHPRCGRFYLRIRDVISVSDNGRTIARPYAQDFDLHPMLRN
jgi:hypothetical protein